MDYDKVTAQALEMAKKAKPWHLKHGGKLFTAVFCQREWIYVVYEDGFEFLRINIKTASKAKAFLAEYLNN